MSYVIGVDLGTGSMKALLLNQEGDIVTSAQSSYPLITLEAGFSEQDPDEWTKAIDSCLKQLVEQQPDAAEKTVGISFSGQMHSLVLLDQFGSVLRNSILWNDVRTSTECQEIEQTLGSDLLKICKNKALEGFTLPKLLWVKKNEPEIWNKVAKFLLPKDYLGYYLTGTIQMDYSDAAGTLLLDMNENKWSSEVFDKLEIDPQLAPNLVLSSQKIGSLKKELAHKYGFKKEISVFAGGADNACAALGSGINSPEIGMISIGTSGVFLASDPSSGDDYQGKIHFFNHCIGSDHYAMGVTLAAGQSLSWLKNTFFPEEDYVDLFKDVELVPSGAKGLLFAPYIMGERTPHTDSQIRGSFIGIDANHQREHFVKAVMEGIVFSIRESKELIEYGTGQRYKQVVSVGGGSKNKEWLKVQANILDAEILVLNADEGPAMGAAMIAAVGSGWFENFSECIDKVVGYTDIVLPQGQEVKRYNQLFSIYTHIYSATQQISHQLSDFR